MAIIDMQRISLIGFEKHQDQVLETLMRIGAVELENIQERTSEEEWEELVTKDGEEETVFELDSDIERIALALKHLSRYSSGKKSFFKTKRELNRADFTNIIRDNKKIHETVDIISDYDEKLSLLRSEENRLESLKANIEPWQALDLPLQTTSTRTSEVLLGVIASAGRDKDEIIGDIEQNAPECTVEIVNTDRDMLYVCIICYRSCADALAEILKKYGFTKAVFKDMEGTAEHNIKIINDRIEEIHKEREQIEEGIESLKDHKDNIEVFHDYLVMRRDRKKAQSSMVKTGKTFMLEGWVPERVSSNVKEELEKHWDCIVEIREPKESEEFPVLLDNPQVVKPFEMITELYSLPRPRGFDPNLLMTPFYFVFFGMMISDAGYGLLIALISGLAILKLKPAGVMGKLIRLLFFGGISTFIWGVLFGGWFGNIIELLSSGRFKIPPVWFNPLDDPMRLLIWCLVFGGVHLFTGMGIKAYILIKQGKLRDAIFDIGFWYLLLIGIVLMFAGSAFAGAGKIMAILGAVLLVLTQGRRQKTIVKKFMSGLLSLYNITSYLSDVLSYSRLLALGLATGVIASVINTAGILFGFNFFGIIVLIVVFLVGHVFNILINALGAYVHASRLQYIEFYGKFYEGGGKAFKPFKINTKYINLN